MRKLTWHGVLDANGVPDLEQPFVSVLVIKRGVDGGVEAGLLPRALLFANDSANPRGKAAISQTNLEVVCTEAARLGWQVGAHRWRIETLANRAALTPGAEARYA
jgi:hypothetical protein